MIIDGLTGEEADPRLWWPEEEADKQRDENPLLRSGDSPEEKLMLAMQRPIEVNPDFNTQQYTELLSKQRQQEAEKMIQQQGGPTLEQMQRHPLEVLRQYPNLDPNWCDPRTSGCSLTQWACAMGFGEVTRALLAMRAEPNQRTGTSCLASACAHNWWDCARALLEAEADANEVVSDGGQSILMWASRIEFCDIDGRSCANPFVGLLLEHRADVHTRDSRGKTPLIHASTGGNLEAVELLLEYKADVDARDCEDQSAFEISMRYYNTAISTRLLPLRRKDGQTQQQESVVATEAPAQ